MGNDPADEIQKLCSITLKAVPPLGAGSGWRNYSVTDANGERLPSVYGIARPSENPNFS